MSTQPTIDPVANSPTKSSEPTAALARPSSQPHTPIRVGTLSELRDRGVITVSGPTGRIAVFPDGDRALAVDNRCPHMGFPLDKGTAKDGILTCHWHQARFDLASGCTFDLFADDVPRFETSVDGGVVFVSPVPARIPDAAHYRRRMRVGVEQNIPLICAKNLLGLLSLDAELGGIALDVARHGASNLSDFGEGLVRLTCVANLYPYLSRDTAYPALLYAIRQVAAESARSVPRRKREPLDTEEHAIETLERWLRQWVQTRHRDGTERTILTAIANASHDDVANLLFAAASERLYANTGHVFDACNKALELVELLGWEEAPSLVPLLMRALTQTRGEEESTAWHHPIEIVEPIHQIAERLPETLARGADAAPGWIAPPQLTEVVLGDDPLAILTALEEALGLGAPPEELARRVAHAASLRLARFAISNEVTDWFDPQHTLNFANAVHQAVTRVATPNTVRGIFHAAIAVYMNRYLNVPAAKLPSETGDLADLPDSPDELRNALLELLDQRSAIDDAARIVSRYVQLGHPIANLIDTLTFAAVREDIDFHSLQVIEASARQCVAWGEGPEIEHILVGAVRSLAAQCPTQRAGQQTANIALRLHRGDKVFE